MAASAVIGALRVNLGLNSASFRSGLEQSNKRLADFGKKAAAGFLAIAAAATGAFAKIKGAADSADTLIKKSRSLGIPVEELSKLSFAAELSGVSMDALSTAVRRASQLVGQHLQGMSNEGTRSFEQLGVALTDAQGNARSMTEILGDVAERFAAMPDGVEKTALAVAMFGRSGADLIPMLNSGREGIAEMANQAERLGLVIDTQTGVAAERFNDNLTRMAAVFTGLWNRVLTNVIPVFADLTDKFSQAALEGGGLDKVANVISRTMIVLARAIGFVFDHLGDLYDLFKIFIALRITFFLTSVVGTMYQLATAVRTVGVTMKIVTSVTRAKITAVLLLAAAVAKLTGTYDDLVGWIEDFSEKVINALPESVRQGIDDLGKSLDALTGNIRQNKATAVDALETFLDAENSVINSGRNVGEAIAGARSRTTSLGAATNKVKDAWAGLRGEVDETGRSVNGIELQTRTFSESISDAFGNFGSSIRGLIDGTKSWQDVLLSVLESLIQVIVQQTILNNIAGAGGGPGGGSNIWAQAATTFIGSLFGFAQGGSFEVGGVGGVDSQFVGFMASPDEVVSVMTPQQQKEAAEARVSDGRSVSVNNHINIQTPDVGGFKASEQQLSARLAQMTQRGARGL